MVAREFSQHTSTGSAVERRLRMENERKEEQERKRADKMAAMAGLKNNMTFAAMLEAARHADAPGIEVRTRALHPLTVSHPRTPPP